MADDEKAGARNVSLIPIPWHNSGNALRQMSLGCKKWLKSEASSHKQLHVPRFSDFVYALDECHYRRGDRWMTIAEVQKAWNGAVFPIGEAWFLPGEAREQ